MRLTRPHRSRRIGRFRLGKVKRIAALVARAVRDDVEFEERCNVRLFRNCANAFRKAQQRLTFLRRYRDARTRDRIEE